MATERIFALDLRLDEAVLLKQILSNHLSDLRMEITDTENYDMRESMKRDEAMIKALIAKLDQMGVGTT